MYNFFLKFHSGFRYIVFILILIAIIQSLAGWLGKKPYTEDNRKLNLFALISAHIQFLIGVILYFVSPFVQFTGATMKDPTIRYWTMEHITGMFIAILLITIGHGRSKKAATAETKHKSIAIFYIIATVIIVAVIIQSGRGLLGMTH